MHTPVSHTKLDFPILLLWVCQGRIPPWCSPNFQSNLNFNPWIRWGNTGPKKMVLPKIETEPVLRLADDRRFLCHRPFKEVNSAHTSVELTLTVPRIGNCSCFYRLKLNRLSQMECHERLRLVQRAISSPQIPTERIVLLVSGRL